MISWVEPSVGSDFERTLLRVIPAITAISRQTAVGRLEELWAAMAPKVAAKSVIAQTVLNESFLVQIDDVSIEEDSGWRPLVERRIAELESTFEAGDYGINILRRPSILAENGDAASASDGRKRLSDGKHTFAALRRMKMRFDADQALPAEQQLTWSSALCDVFLTGVKCLLVQFDEPEMSIAYNSLAHDSDSNKYHPTSLRMLVRTVALYRLKVPGGDWGTHRVSSSPCTVSARGRSCTA